MAIPVLAVGDIIQTIIQSKCNGQIMLNVLHYKVKTALGQTPYFEALDLIGQAIGDPNNDTIVKRMLPLLGNNVTVDWVQVQRIRPQRTLYTRHAVGAAGQGGSACTAQNVSLVITKQTSKVGRGRAGSFHIGGLAPDKYVGGNITGAALGTANGVAGGLFLPIQTGQTGGVLDPITYDPRAGSAPPDADVLNAFPQTTLRIMRRRTVGLGI